MSIVGNSIYLKSSDKKTKLSVTLGDTLGVYVGLALNGTARINWGDFTQESVVTGSSLTTIVYSEKHTYAESGDYIIEIDIIDGNADVRGQNATARKQSRLISSSNSSSASTINKILNALQSVELGSGIVGVDVCGFRGCTGLSSITIPSNVTSIGNYAFRDCTGLTSITIPSSVTSIRGSAFSGCTGLVSLDMKFAQITSLSIFGDTTTYSNLETVYLPYVIEDLTQCFYDCPSLMSISIPSSCKYIYDASFNKCPINKIRFDGSQPPTVAKKNTGIIPFAHLPVSCIISVPVGALNTYENSQNYPSSSTYTYIEE